MQANFERISLILEAFLMMAEPRALQGFHWLTAARGNSLRIEANIGLWHASSHDMYQNGGALMRSSSTLGLKRYNTKNILRATTRHIFDCFDKAPLAPLSSVASILSGQALYIESRPPFSSAVMPTKAKIPAIAETTDALR